MQFSFNTATGNLNWRKDNLSGRIFTENFTYDDLDKLTNSQIGASGIKVGKKFVSKILRVSLLKIEPTRIC